MGFSAGGGSGSNIASAGDVVFSNTANNQVLTYDSSLQKWKNAAPQLTSGSLSLKTWEDASRSIQAMSPSTESGLTAIAANASTDDAPRIQAMLNYIKNTYGGGRLLLPYGKTSNCNSTITIPAGVQVVGSAKTVWDFWYAGTAVTAIVINDNDCTPIDGLTIHGIQWEANNSGRNVTTCTGLNITGHGLNFRDVHIGGFNWGIDITNDNTYIISFEQSSVIGCMVCINADIANAWTGASAAPGNSGERITFTDCVFANSATVYWATGNGTDVFFTHTSMDFNNTVGRQQNAHVFFNNSHIESTYDGTDHYLIDMSANPRLFMTNCEFVMGSAGIYYVLNPANGPWNYGAGMMHVSSCYAYFNMTSNASTAGAVGSSFSEPMIAVPQGATSITVASLFVSKWNAVKVNMAATDGGAAANVTARISAMNVVDGTVTVTLSSAAPAGTFIELNF
jgi:hypothetical protein